MNKYVSLIIIVIIRIYTHIHTHMIYILIYYYYYTQISVKIKNITFLILKYSAFISHHLIERTDSLNHGKQVVLLTTIINGSPVYIQTGLQLTTTLIMLIISTIN